MKAFFNKALKFQTLHVARLMRVDKVSYTVHPRVLSKPLIFSTKCDIRLLANFQELHYKKHYPRIAQPYLLLAWS